MKKISEVLSVQLFDISPSFKHYTPDQIMTAAALSTIKPENVEEILEKISEKDVEMIHRESTRRGHASITTLPSIYLVFDGSRALDYYFTSIRHTRALVLSSRRVSWKKEDILIPDGIYHTKFKSDYENILSKQFDFYSEAISLNVPLEQARKALGLGFRSHFLLSMSVDAGTELSKNVDYEYIPTEVHLASRKISDLLRENVPKIYENKSKLKMRTLYPFPNIFTDPYFSPDYSEYLERPSILNCSIHKSFWELKEKLDSRKDENYFEKLSDIARAKVSVTYTKPMSL
ncbi:MAG: FAD-dependent thymidylate synthase, partial [Candidatus Aenigmatarchaeota archaeon]